MEWYYADGGQRMGPVPESELQALYTAGRVRPDTLVWRAGMGDWQTLSAAQPGFLSAGAATYGHYCTECGRQYAAADLIAFGGARVCANCKDVFFQRVREQGAAVAATPALLRYAGFWIRFLARIIDGVIVSVVLFVVGMVWSLLARGALMRGVAGNVAPADLAMFWGSLIAVYSIALVFSVAYESWFVHNRGGTPGKLALGLRVVRSNGSGLTMGRSVGRVFAYLLDSLIPFAIGFIIAGFDAEKRALHDHICDTRVIYKAA